MTTRKKTIFGILIVGLGLLTWRGLTVGQGPKQLHAGDTFPATRSRNIHGAEVVLPDTKTTWVHLQFRRFAGCPICNLHLHSFVARAAEIKAAGIREIVVFHSSNAALLPFQGSFPFDVIGDPEKKLYAEFGVESSVFSVLNPAAWPAMFKGQALKDRPQGDPEGGPFGLPADLLIRSDGKVAASHYGRHAYDQWSVDELLALAKN